MNDAARREVRFALHHITGAKDGDFDEYEQEKLYEGLDDDQRGLLAYHLGVAAVQGQVEVRQELKALREELCGTLRALQTELAATRGELEEARRGNGVNRRMFLVASGLGAGAATVIVKLAEWIGVTP